ncbi:hypothetical protein GIB67_004504 [Kingdonia uniflora]|uniref:Uncharacterized protein n=1 Tax=Kingdonia uniflora TaxID=39325 RepID=A0A7J7MRR5_9MAGN|nr:hypothetical protein GIB67_004504 [Kingdonia uniflora]
MATTTFNPSPTALLSPTNNRFSSSLSLRGKSLISTNKSAKTTQSRSRNGGGVVVVTCSASSALLPSALLFDCDGVLVDTEKDGHRISFNDTFAERELGVTWDVDLYGELLKIGGGKERMTAYFNKMGWPENAPKSEEERKEFVAALHKRKTELFMVLIEKKLLPLRPGVTKLVDQALEKDVKVAVCSTSNEKAVSAIVYCLLGPERAGKIDIFAGDVVPRKKPDPAIYLLAASTLGVEPQSCVVVEDSAIGLSAAKAAGMNCIVTKSGYTSDEDFLNADAVFDCIGDPPTERFDLAFCASLLEKQHNTGEEIVRKIEEALKDIDVGILVNNVGMAYPYAQFFHEMELELMDGVIKVNVYGAMWVTKAVVPGMLKKKKGAIINIGSGKTKRVCRYIEMFSRSLSLEYKQHGIDVQCQVVGIEGHNPSGHCLIASKVVDSIPLLVSSDLELPPSKKQAVDQEFQPNSPSSTSEELSLAIVFYVVFNNFYPPYPPSEDVPLDLSLSPESLQITYVPDILILPSDLAPFVKEENTTIKIQDYRKDIVQNNSLRQ